MPTMNEKTTAAYFFLALQKKVLIYSIYFANYSKSKNMSVGKVCIKHFEFACMDILRPEIIDSSMPMFNNGYASAVCSKSAQDG